MHIIKWWWAWTLRDRMIILTLFVKWQIIWNPRFKSRGLVLEHFQRVFPQKCSTLDYSLKNILLITTFISINMDAQALIFKFQCSFIVISDRFFHFLAKLFMKSVYTSAWKLHNTVWTGFRAPYSSILFQYSRQFYHHFIGLQARFVSWLS